MATSSVAVTPGTGKNLATHSFSEDAITKEISRANLSSAAGVDLTDATGIKISTSQLATLQTAVKVMSDGYQLVGLPTDQAVPNKVQAQSSGTTGSRVVASASSNTATSLKASAGNIYEIDVFNVAAYDVFLKLYNKASAPTVGSDTPVWTIPIKTGTGYSRSFPFGRNFSTGIAYAITKLQADSDTTALAARLSR